jgi:hypothetical protein
VFHNSIRPRRERPAARASTSLPIWLTAAGAVAILVSATIAFWQLRKRDEASVAEPVAAASTSASAAPSSSAMLDPSSLFAQAKSRALAWHEDATLVELDLAPVLDGKVDPSATLELVFGKPMGKRIGPGASVQSGLFVVTADSQGLRSGERPGSNASAVAEPNCIFEDVVDKVAKSGLSTHDRLRFRYAQSQKNGRGLWFVSRDGEAEPLRTLDGANCAIIVASTPPAMKK